MTVSRLIKHIWKGCPKCGTPRPPKAFVCQTPGCKAQFDTEYNILKYDHGASSSKGLNYR